ncbi:TIGR02569 family protein [Catellatospora sp. TT07R-123]|uniref:phosphotransferase n=1 Tax=Catellatospora sp. TT07R-123 TaxID=2733863 RepID=UPI001B129BA0|nr:phosphotransferase [Catellatospora sp. TT07R-123]GHJ46500.1 TIGR02569 family protein [Catellatospora sp. TT07R-123]
MSRDQLPSTVLHAFGVEGPARRLDGGQGDSWAADDLVFKPDGGPLQEWLAGALAEVTPDGFRIAEPVCTRDGAWVSHGWSATRWVEGSEPDYSAVSTWRDILAAGRAFHRAVAHLGRPDFLEARQDWWARADRAVWGEQEIQFRPEFAAVARRLRGALEPLGRPQLVHGDLTKNVLFAPGLAPAVIDISPYWRPPQYAEGVVVADALCWHGAPATLWKTVDVPVAAVARALLFRMATTNERVAAGADGVDLRDEARRYGLAAAAIGL